MQHSKTVWKKRLGLVTAILITVQAICLCCVSVVNAKESSRSLATPASADESAVNMRLTGWLNEKIYSATHSRSCWLYDLMTAAGFTMDVDRNNALAIFDRAKEEGVIESYHEGEPYLPVNRRFVGYTMVRALGYQQKDAGCLYDISPEESYLSTMAYYGYFIPDVNYCIHPDAVVTPEEYDALLAELDRYHMFRGKRLLSFGDSIMYGAGNGGEGISDMIAQKYGMSNSDYAVSGATFGYCKGRGHIPDQIRRAGVDGRRADVILINGGTNDVNHTTLGAVHKGFDMQKVEETDFTAGFERSLWLIGRLWENVPVIYIRAHNMVIDNDAGEELFGDRALSVAQKWSVPAVDLYRNSGMNTANPVICNRYTYVNPNKGMISDSVHPNAVGYAKFYLPLISDAMTRAVSGEEVTP